MTIAANKLIALGELAAQAELEGEKEIAEGYRKRQFDILASMPVPNPRLIASRLITEAMDRNADDDPLAEYREPLVKIDAPVVCWKSLAAAGLLGLIVWAAIIGLVVWRMRQ